MKYTYKEGLVSIVTPCYNGEDYLDRFFHSLKNQTYNNLEIILVDDGSTDKTSQKVEYYIDIFKKLDIEIKYIYQNNSGQAVAINSGLKFVNGEYLVWADCDDYYENDAFENMISYLDKNNMEFMRGEVCFRKGNDTLKVDHYGKSKNPNNFNIFDDYIFETDAYAFPGIFMVKMRYFDKCLTDRHIFDTTRVGQNWQLILPLAYKSKCGYLNKVVYNIVLTSESHSRQRRTLRDTVKRFFGMREILLTIILDLGMSDKEFNKYKCRINIKYLRMIIKTIFIFMPKAYIKRWLGV